MNTDGLRDVNYLLDDLFADTALQKRFSLDPAVVMQNYSLSDDQRDALVSGDSDALISLGLDERHMRQMRLSW